MSYVQGFLVPVPEEKREAYRAMAAQAAPIFAEHGAVRVVEAWADDVRDGQRTDMKKAVKAEAGETVVFSWIEWPDGATCEAAGEKMMADERMQPPAGGMPFDGKRMVYGGFDVVHTAGAGGPTGYVDGIVARIPGGEAQTVVDFETRMEAFFFAQGATRMVSGLATDLKPGHTTDFLMAVAAKEGDAITFGWVEWPDKETRDKGMGAMMSNEGMASIPPAFDGPTAIFGGFVPILDTQEK